MMVNLTWRIALAAALLWLSFGLGGEAEAGGIALNTPHGLQPGDTFRFAFVTDGQTPATSTSISYYNQFVNTQAAGATYQGAVITWNAIASTSSVNAQDNIGYYTVPVYLADGTLVTTSTTGAGMWSGTLNNAIDEDLSGGTPDQFVWAGTNAGGMTYKPLGSSFPSFGDSEDKDSLWVNDFSDSASSNSMNMYSISVVLTVAPEPSSLFMAGTAIFAGFAFGWSRKRRDHRRRTPS